MKVDSRFCHKWFTRRHLVIVHTLPTTNAPIKQCLTYRQLMFVKPVFSSPPPPPPCSCSRLLWPIFQKAGDHQTFILSQIWASRWEERRWDNRGQKAAKGDQKVLITVPHLILLWLVRTNTSHSSLAAEPVLLLKVDKIDPSNAPLIPNLQKHVFSKLLQIHEGVSSCFLYMWTRVNGRSLIGRRWKNEHLLVRYIVVKLVKT